MVQNSPGSKEILFRESIETLQHLSTTFSPQEKLQVIHQTFQEINKVIGLFFPSSPSRSHHLLLTYLRDELNRTVFDYSLGCRKTSSEVHFMDHGRTFSSFPIHGRTSQNQTSGIRSSFCRCFYGEAFGAWRTRTDAHHIKG